MIRHAWGRVARLQALVMDQAGPAWAVDQPVTSTSAGVCFAGGVSS